MLKIDSSTNVADKTEYLHVEKTETRSLTFTLY
jgi:hypothetical protein